MKQKWIDSTVIKAFMKHRGGEVDEKRFGPFKVWQGYIRCVWGIGEYFNIDPTIVRLGFVIATVLFSGLGLFAYIVAIFVIPEADSAANGFTDYAQKDLTIIMTLTRISAKYWKMMRNI